MKKQVKKLVAFLSILAMVVFAMAAAPTTASAASTSWNFKSSNFKSLGGLRCMRMLRTGVDLELLNHRIAQGTLREHAFDSNLKRTARMLRLHLFERGLVDATRIAGVAIVGLLRGFFTRETNLVGVDDDDVITRINVRREFRLVLAAQTQGNLSREAAKNLVRAIDHIPVALDFKRLGREGLHCISPNQCGQKEQKLTEDGAPALTPQSGKVLGDCLTFFA